ncbi:MAG: ADP-ribosylglycohydrolase family protein [Rhodothermales bacterium]|nr:ADP-ribosylglycohydrolase family protein [Rhodothermales bacterium]
MTGIIHRFNRRYVLQAVLILLLAGSPLADPARSQNAATSGLQDRIEGLLIGSAIGDAAGGPFEFQPPAYLTPYDRTAPLDSTSIRELADRFTLSEYVLVDQAAPYGPWLNRAPAGTVTDDTRFKLLFMRSLSMSSETEGACMPGAEAFAEELLRWHGDADGPFGDLPQMWLDEFAPSARWILGDRDPDLTAPPERQWGGIPTMAGQMPFLPVAGLYPGAPEQAYRAVWNVNFLDNGWGRDVTASLIGGLSHAIIPGATWVSVENAMRATDPFGFGRVPWVERRLERWLDEAHAIAREAEGRPSVLYDLLEARLGAETWWEAHVPLVVVFAAAATARYDPLATMQLILEFGHDTDSYLQLAGAMFGALHGTDIFPPAMRTAVAHRLQEDFGESVGEWAERLTSCALRR